MWRKFTEKAGTSCPLVRSWIVTVFMTVTIDSAEPVNGSGARDALTPGRERLTMLHMRHFRVTAVLALVLTACGGQRTAENAKASPTPGESSITAKSTSPPTKARPRRPAGTARPRGPERARLPRTAIRRWSSANRPAYVESDACRKDAQPALNMLALALTDKDMRNIPFVLDTLDSTWSLQFRHCTGMVTRPAGVSYRAVDRAFNRAITGRGDVGKSLARAQSSLVLAQAALSATK